MVFAVGSEVVNTLSRLMDVKWLLAVNSGALKAIRLKVVRQVPHHNLPSLPLMIQILGHQSVVLSEEPALLDQPYSKVGVPLTEGLSSMIPTRWTPVPMVTQEENVSMSIMI